MGKVLVLVFGLILSLVGCGEKNININKEVETTISSEWEFPEKKPIPEGGWTYDTLMDSIWINGRYVRLPCKLEDFGEGVELVIDHILIPRVNRIAADLFLNGEWLGWVNIYQDEINLDTIINNGEIVSLVVSDLFGPVEPVANLTAINGIKLGDSVEDVLKFFNPVSDVEYPNQYNLKVYNEENKELSVGIRVDDNQQVVTIVIVLLEYFEYEMSLVSD